MSRDDDKNINALEAPRGRWERIAIKIDSGAIDTVMPSNTAQFFPVKETEASKSGRGFRAANGTHIANHGERHIKGLGDQWQALNLKAQVADVKTTLGSVFQMLKAGNKVHFEKDNCYIENDRTGVRTPIEEVAGTFEVGVWVPKAPERRVKWSSPISTTNSFAVLQEDSDEDEDKMSGFAWQNSA